MKRTASAAVVAVALLLAGAPVLEAQEAGPEAPMRAFHDSVTRIPTLPTPAPIDENRHEYHQDGHAEDVDQLDPRTDQFDVGVQLTLHFAKFLAGLQLLLLEQTFERGDVTRDWYEERRRTREEPRP